MGQQISDQTQLVLNKLPEKVANMSHWFEKINKRRGIAEASRVMNLYQFIQLYKDITSQAA
ncbi:hypothetical protein QTO34_017141 [Cnephaeus nilssonii]|uniref:Uncharacterized protein n=1 Tax=Cnephaeus nilssonii TaxID=3371016 RepID=A0AA40I0G7_CNENI|nr:hypothetical protein QTO34_017141 [Eptesicus nilssonii]